MVGMPLVGRPMAPLQLTLLGGFQARIGSGPALPLPTKKAQALLAYLALPPKGRPCYACFPRSRPAPRRPPGAAPVSGTKTSALRIAVPTTSADPHAPKVLGA
jgi:hypothetical protein